MDGILRRIGLLIMHGWPGFCRVWKDGAVSGLFVAVGFAMLLNLSLLTTWVWSDLLPEGVRVLLWSVTAFTWIIGWVDSNRFLANHLFLSAQDGQLDLFLAARGEYLRCEWGRSEDLLCSILHENPRDVEARLMLATLNRHQGRIPEAREHLRRLQRLERAGEWNMEIGREWRQLGLLEASSELDVSAPEDQMEVEADRCQAA